jgi:hypothetical protein
MAILFGGEVFGTYVVNWIEQRARPIESNPTFQNGPPKHEFFFELYFLVRIISISLQNDAM